MIEFTEGLVVLVQIVVVSFISGLIGEFYRSTLSEFSTSFSIFLAQFSIIVAISTLIGCIIYNISNQKTLSVIMSAILALQSDKFLIGLSQGTVRGVIRKIADYVDSDGKDK